MAFKEPGVKPHYGPSWTFRILHAEVFLTFEPAQSRYEGRTLFRLQSLPTFKGEVKLDLEDVQVESVRTEEGKALPFELTDTHLVIEVSDLSHRIEVVYSTDAPRAGLYFTGPNEGEPERQHMVWTQCQDEDAHFFMPCLDHPRIKHPWTVHLKAPEGYTLLSNGELEREVTEGGWTTATWEVADPVPAYLFTAVAARLESVETEWKGRPVRYFKPAEDAGDLDLAMGKTPRMMQVFSDYLGVEFAWPRYDQVVVHDFVFGGMENTACTTMTDVLLVDDKVGPHWPADMLVCHELAHQWFGDLLTCQDWSQGWLNESFATFMETVWWDHEFAGPEATWYAYEHAQAYFGEDSDRYRRPIMSYDFREPIDLFDRHLYEKGAVVLRTLKHQLGEEAFRAALKLYLETHAHGTVHGRHFLRAVEEATGQNMDRFYQQWLLGAGHPHLKVTLAQEEGLVTVQVTQKQSGDDTPEAFAFGLPVRVIGRKPGQQMKVVLPVAERERTWALPVAFPVQTVLVDEGFTVLAEVKVSGPKAWLQKAALGDDPVWAVRALRGLGTSNTVASRRFLARALVEAPFWAVRAEAAELLAKMGMDDVWPVLIGALRKEQEPRALAAIAKALGKRRHADACTALQDRLKAGDLTWHATGAILVALGKTRQPGVADVLKGWLDTSSWSDIVRTKALMGLAELRDEAVLPTLLQQLDKPASDRAQAGAAEAVATLGKHLPSLKGRCREALEKVALQGRFRARIAGVKGLGKLGDAEARAVLDKVHGSDPDGRLRRLAYEALVTLRGHDEAATKALESRMDELVAEQRKLRARLERLES